ncbi:autophagy-related protein 13 [Phymastichus coffea]|uniref:autophagy-related protein 13 n=1 Tax=Phymastichus coffea TaxID=108790 RepID=UPI00273C5074|nr:autophagy-related protein 13 [Phymastichus coffea]
MSSFKLSLQDRRDLEKFTRFLALKVAQIVVQSRSGDKIITKCKPNSSGTDWFNLAIEDLPEVLMEAKRSLCEEIINSPVPLCIEISLRTVEGDSMVLETWTLGIMPEHSDPALRITYTVYNRMGILLKSLLSVSRITPAYKLSRRQGSDSYVICYRIYMGDPQLHCLGENYKHVRVGYLCTPIGMIHLSVSYRTKMTISPTQNSRDSIMLKSDHFHSDLSPKHTRYQKNGGNSTFFSDIVKVGAFVVNKQISMNEDGFHLDVPFSSLLGVHQILPSTVTLPSATFDPDQIAVTTVTSQSVIDTNNSNEQCHDVTTVKYNSHNESRRSSCSVISTNDDFIMVDLKTPFAATNTNSDLGNFYRECQSAPQLQTFIEEQTLGEQVGDLTKQIETFETNMHLYEDLLNSLYKSENNN